MENKETNEATNQALPQSVLDAKAQGHTVFAAASESGKTFYLRKPTKSEMLLFQDGLAKGGSIASLQEKFVRSLFVGENTAEFDAYLNAMPLAVGGLFTLAAEDLGLKENFTKTAV